MTNPAAKPLIQPWDEHNQQLIANVHPPDWVNPKPAARYNLVVIGAGTAGLVTAAGAAGLGAKVALVERHLMGGDCLNVGCVPSKALIRAARAMADVRNSRDFGINIPKGVEVDFSAIMKRMRRLRTHISPNDSAVRFRELGVDVFLGDPSFADSESVRVGDESLKFSKAVIATGARAVALPIPGLKEAGYLTNESVFSLTELPRRMVVIGAGPIGCELAQAFRRFGTEVHVLEVASQILIREDRAAAAIVQAALERDGIHFHCCAEIKQITISGQEKVFEFVCDGDRESLSVDQILLSVGRAPNVEGLNLEKVDVRYDKGGVKVNDYLETSNPAIYAAGDICLPLKFTHTADFAARAVIQNALFGKLNLLTGGKRKISALTIPWCTYTDPEIAHVGLYEPDAVERGMEVQTYEQRFEDVDRAILDGETNGLVRIHVRKGSDQILGATIVARHAGEMISEVSTAMAAGIGLGKLANVIHPYPTQAEAIRKCGDAYNRTRLTPRLKQFFRWWLKRGVR